jgi:ABC-type lipopolysaccharide export system ATPase subunit
VVRVGEWRVSFSVAGGEVFGFLGPNGAGKTTTVRILGTLISPTAGSATVAGITVGPDSAVEIRRRIAVMPESPGLYQRLTVAENLEYFARLYGLPRSRERIKAARAAVALADPAHDLTGSLSKGLRQRTLLIRGRKCATRLLLHLQNSPPIPPLQHMPQNSRKRRTGFDHRNPDRPLFRVLGDPLGTPTYRAQRRHHHVTTPPRNYGK